MSDKVEIDLEDLDDLEDLIGDERKEASFSFQKVFAHLVLNWQWYLLSLIICMCGAYLYLRYAQPIYQVSARMLVKDEDKKAGTPIKQMLPNMEDFGIMNNSSGFENEIEILQSPVTVHDAVKRLKLYTDYQLDGRIRNQLLYADQPVSVDLDPMSLDSLDYYMLEGIRSIQIAIMKKEEGYHADIGLVYNGKVMKEYSEDIDSLGTSFKTDYGTISFMSNPKYNTYKEDRFKKGFALHVTIRPPMAVALDYMRRLSVEPISKRTTIASITLNDENVIRGVDFINALVLCYNDQANIDKNEIAQKTEQFINERLEKIDAELGTTENSLENYKRRNSVTSIEADAAQSLQLSAQFSARLADANTQLQLLDYLRQYVDNPDNRYKLIPANIGMNDQASTQLITSYNSAVQERNRLMRSASEQSPQVQTLTTALDELEVSIRQAFAQARHSAELQRSSIQGQYAKYQGRIGSTPEQERVLNQIGRQQEVRSGLYLLLLQKREENSISLAATADKGKLIAAPLNMGQVSPRKGMILGTAFIIGLLIPFVFLLVIELLRYRIEGREDVASLTKVPIVADVPVANEKAMTAAGIVVQADKNSQMDEVFRSLRTNVQFMMAENEKIILFTSGTSGEGKTFLAANLAVSFALLGKKVMLVGCDIRKPALGRLFGTTNSKQGLTNLLRVENVTRELLHKEMYSSGVNPNLDLLMSGPVPPNPTELLSRNTLKEVLDLLSEEYDYIILDSAPVGLVTDTLQIARYANVSCFVCRADYTPKANIALLDSLAQEHKLPNACVVLNGVDMSKRKYGYYYGYGYYGKYGRYGYSKYGYSRYGYGNYGSYANYANSHYGNKDDNSIKK
jgi:capsular exopolysaccharide synthesis family protein